MKVTGKLFRAYHALREIIFTMHKFFQVSAKCVISMQIAMAKTLLRHIMATGGPMQLAQIFFRASMKKLAKKEMKQLH